MSEIQGGGGIRFSGPLPNQPPKVDTNTELGQKMAKASLSAKDKAAAEGKASEPKDTVTRKVQGKNRTEKKSVVTVTLGDGQTIAIEVANLNRDYLLKALAQAANLDPRLYEGVQPILQKLRQEQAETEQ